MHPELFRIGSLTVYTYGAMFALGITVSAYLASRRASAIQIDSFKGFDLVVWTGLIGIVGARLAYIAENINYFSSNPAEAFKLWQGGLIYHGGVLASLGYVYFFAKKEKKSFLAVLDFLIPYVSLSYGVGRIGCYLNGCCYGTPFHGPWAVEYPFLNGSVHPTQIYSAAVGFVLFWVLLKLDQRKLFLGQTSAVYFIIYSASRIAIEFYRGDKTHTVLGFATGAQGVFLGIFLISLVSYIILRLKHR